MIRPPHHERRAHPRVERSDRIFVKLYEVQGHHDLADHEMNGHTADISDGGMRIEIDRDLATGTELKLRIWVTDPPGAFIHRGAVRWTLPVEQRTGRWQIGVEFTGTSAEHAAEWRRLVSEIRQAVARGDYANRRAPAKPS